MDAERFNSARRFALGCVLVWVLYSLAVNLFDFTDNFVLQPKRMRDAAAARRQRMDAPELEVLLRKEQVVPGGSPLHCESAPRDWDYVCSFMPTPMQSRTQLRFGV